MGGWAVGCSCFVYLDTPDAIQTTLVSFQITVVSPEHRCVNNLSDAIVDVCEALRTCKSVIASGKIGTSRQCTGSPAHPSSLPRATSNTDIKLTNSIEQPQQQLVTPIQPTTMLASRVALRSVRVAAPRLSLAASRGFADEKSSQGQQQQRPAQSSAPPSSSSSSASQNVTVPAEVYGLDGTYASALVCTARGDPCSFAEPTAQI